MKPSAEEYERVLSKKAIVDRLIDMEGEQNICVLFAAESGSRAWGFESPDSDYDIRFIYTRPLGEYVRIDQPKDTIEITEGDYDFAGWDLRKAFTLMRKGNAAPLEWMNSPIIYRSVSAFQHMVYGHVIPHPTSPHEYGVPREALFNHYAGLAFSTCKQHIDGYRHTGVPLKKYFYALRAILSAQWVFNHDTMPAVSFPELLTQSSIVDSLDKEIRDLIIVKKRVNERDGVVVSEQLREWVIYSATSLKMLKVPHFDNTELTRQLDSISHYYFRNYGDQP